MECQDGDATIRVQTAGKISQKTVERGEFVIHHDAQRLEDATNGIINLIIHDFAQKRAADGLGQRGRGWKRLPGEDSGQNGGLRFIGIFLKDDGQVFGAGPLQYDGSRSEERRVGKECRSRWSPY